MHTNSTEIVQPCIKANVCHVSFILRLGTLSVSSLVIRNVIVENAVRRRLLVQPGRLLFHDATNQRLLPAPVAAAVDLVSLKDGKVKVTSTGEVMTMDEAVRQQVLLRFDDVMLVFGENQTLVTLSDASELHAAVRLTSGEVLHPRTREFVTYDSALRDDVIFPLDSTLFRHRSADGNEELVPLRQAIHYEYIDPTSAQTLDPTSGDVISIQEAIRRRVIFNPSLLRVLDPSTGNLVSFENARTRGLVDSRGHVTSREGGWLPLAAALADRKSVV